MNIRRLSTRAAVAGVIALAMGSSACFTDAEGRRPSADLMFFPTGLTVSPGHRLLYVANSDFDLSYSGGSVQVLDLAAIRNDITPIITALSNGEGASKACNDAGLQLNPDPWLNPGPCDAFPLKPYVGAAAFTGAFASGLLLLHESDGERVRLFAPVRGDPSITYFEVEDDRAADSDFTPQFKLDCAQTSDGFCGEAHRVGQDPERSLRGIQLPADPVGIAASANGEAIVSAHQTQKAASLTMNPWDGLPYLSYFASNLAEGPTEVATIPEPAMLAEAKEKAAELGKSFVYRSGFALTFRSTAEIDFMRFYADSGAVPPRPFIFRTDSFPITTNNTGFDSRGLAILSRERRNCEASCVNSTDSLACSTACAEDTAMPIFVANRTPASLLIGEVRTIVNRSTVGTGAEAQTIASSAFETMSLHDSLPLDFGPSRVEVGPVIDANGELVDRVFVVCFDSRLIFVIDPKQNRVETIIHTGRGPHDIAIDVDETDGTHAFLYVGHFTDSYIGVVDLDMRRPLTYGAMFASIGTPTPPQESR